MLINTREFRKGDVAYLADRFPVFARVAPSIYLTKDGGLLRLFDLAPIDPLGMDDHGIEQIYETLNAELSRFGPGYAFWFEHARRKATKPEAPLWPNAASRAFDDERMAPYDNGERFATRFHIGVFWLPPSDIEGKADGVLVRKGKVSGPPDQTGYVDDFRRETSAFAAALRRCVKWILPCTDKSGDTYLHSCISHHAHDVEIGDPLFIDGHLVDCDHNGAAKPMLGDVHLRCIGIRGFPKGTADGVLDELSAVPIEHRYVVRWISMGRTESQRRLEKILNTYLFHKVSLKSLAIAMITKEEAKTVKKESVHAAEEADQALEEEIRQGQAHGLLTVVFMLWHKNRSKADHASQVAQGIFRSKGFTAKEETFLAQEAFLSTIPGHAYANIARFMVPSRTCAHMAPITHDWTGNEIVPPILVARTSGKDPFRVSLRAHGVDHAILIGQSGNGKSVLLGSLALGAQRDPERQIIIIERGRSARIMTLCCGGQHIDIGAGRQSFQPLADADTEGGFARSISWAEMTIADRGVAITPEIRRRVRSAIELIATRPRHERTVTLFHAFLPPGDAKDSLIPFLGSMLDGARDPDLSAPVITLEMSELMDAENRPFLVPTLIHIFQLIRTMVRSGKGFLIIDEAWRFVAENLVAGPHILEFLKEARKYDWGIILSTQELEDFASSPLAAAIMDNCKTRLFTADKAAEQKLQAEQYEAIGIKARQRAVLAQAIPASEYVISQEGNLGVFCLDLADVGLALVASNSDEDHAAADNILANYGHSGFFRHWLAFKGLGPDPVSKRRFLDAAE